MDEAREQYDKLLQSGDLLMMFPDMQGEWKADKTQFLQMYDSNQYALEDDINVEVPIEFTNQDLNMFE